MRGAYRLRVWQRDLGIRRDRVRFAFKGTGVSVGVGERVIRVSTVPPAARDASFGVDLDLLAGWLEANGRREIGFVQVGAFDGHANDPINALVHQRGWRGVLVEPGPDGFSGLQSTYAGVADLVLVNAAVGPEAGTREFWFVDGAQADDPWWRAQISSFDRDHLLRHIRDRQDLRDRVTSRMVDVVTLADLFHRSPRPVDVLQVDAEGYDAEIVCSLDVTGHLPTVVRFEHRHLSTVDHQRALAHLRPHGYRFAVNEDDTIALRHARGRGATAET